MNDNALPSNGNQNSSFKGMGLSELIDIPAFQKQLDSFYDLTKIPSAISTPDQLPHAAACAGRS